MQNPRHKTLSATLAKEILDGKFPVGSRFPTERELQSRFQVGRHTVREALKALSDQGMLGRRRKTGTTVLASTPFVHYTHILRDTAGLFGFADETSLAIRYMGFVRTPALITELKETGADADRWLRIAGVRSVRRDGSTLCWSEVYIPSSFPLNREAVRRTSGAVYKLTMETHGLRLNYVEQEIKATTLPGPIADLLSAEPDSAALLVIRRYVAHTGATFEISANLYPASRYSVRSVIR